MQLAPKAMERENVDKDGQNHSHNTTVVNKVEFSF